MENLKLHNKEISDEAIDAKCEKYKTKQREQAEKHIMQMNIFCDYEGFIFFNELFFFLFKYSLEAKVNAFDEEATGKALDRRLQAQIILRKEEYITLKKISVLKKKVSQCLIFARLHST